MSCINNYKCSNKECGFELNLSKISPVWKNGTPEDEKMLPARPEYVLERVSMEFCKACKEVVTVESATYICPNCASAHTFLKDDETCPMCNVGTVSEDQRSKVWF
jgi:RNA polymerase subunit RPABC4/transcription elongation factor Spt4